MKKFLSLLSLVFLFQHGVVKAQAFQYRPSNPVFGGVYNYNGLLSSAQAQDTNKDPTAKTAAAVRADPNSASEFSANLQRQLLSRLSRQLLDQQFGEGTLQEGSFQFGDLQVDVSEGAEGIIIRIIDAKGGESTITVPFF